MGSWFEPGFGSPCAPWRWVAGHAPAGHMAIRDGFPGALTPGTWLGLLALESQRDGVASHAPVGHMAFRDGFPGARTPGTWLGLLAL